MPNELEEVGAKIKHSDKAKVVAVIVGVLTLMVTWAAYKRSQANAQSQSAQPVNPATGMPYPGSGSGIPSGIAGGSAVAPDFSGIMATLSGLEGQIQAQNGIIQQIQSAIPSPVPPPASGTPAPPSNPYAGETLIGSGYTAPGGPNTSVTDLSGRVWTWIGSPAQEQALQGSGGTFGIQPLPGQFAPVGTQANPLLPGTPQFYSSKAA